MGIPELRKLRQLEEENIKLKQIVADLSLDKQMLQDVLKKVLTTSQKRNTIEGLYRDYQISVRRICSVLKVERSMYYYKHRGLSNPFTESFNGSFRDECLSTNWFLSLPEAEGKIESYIREYNEFRPHRFLQGRTPQEAENEYILETKKADFSNNAWSKNWDGLRLKIAHFSSHSMRKTFGRRVVDMAGANSEMALIKLSKLFNH